MPESAVNNKRIAKNTMMLYLRMFLLLAISLYTSRVILQVLGVEDYGVYNAVGGFVAMFGVLMSVLYNVGPEIREIKEMHNFILVTSVADELIPLGEVPQDFLKGDKVRVTGGLFEGAEGVIKRIKGSRRLIVSIDCFTAVATCFIRPELLEKV